MIVLAVFSLVVASVPLLGGRLTRLADLRVRWWGLLGAALALQLLVLEVAPTQLTAQVAEGLHLLSYALAAAFLVGNLRIPGLELVAVGGGLNAAAIVANGGVMPASPRAVAVAGLDAEGGFANSAVVDEPRLAWLGDVFAVPASWPLSNVFSVGDVVLLVGAVVLLHGWCGSRLGPLVGVELVDAPVTPEEAVPAPAAG